MFVFNPDPMNSKNMMKPTRCEANMAHVIQAWPDSGLGFQGKVLTQFEPVPSSLEGVGCRVQGVGCRV